jgi:hypothetical protein
VPAGPRAGQADASRLTRRPRRDAAAALVVLAVAAIVVGIDANRTASAPAPSHVDTAARGTAPADAAPTAVDPGPSATLLTPTSSSPAMQVPPASTVDHPTVHGGTFSYAPGAGPVGGGSGALLRYHVAVQDGIGVTPVEFAAEVQAIVDDPRGWTAGGTVRFQRVPVGWAAGFTVYLATAAVSEAICAEQWVQTEGFTNCRLGTGKVVINLDRWRSAVPHYGAALDVYQAYAINHEVGHQLGHGHELCPGPGRAAPVMQQQTLGLHGCVANSWPYLDGRRYQGAPGPP